MIFLANPCGPDVLTAMQAGALGMIVTAGKQQGDEREALNRGVQWCADNGAFGKSYPGDDEFLAWLDRLPNRDTCLFAVAPDVVCDHQRTYRRSSRLMPAIRALGYRVAFVAQNGARPYNTPWTEFDALFIGGDDEFKLGPAARELVSEAQRRGKWVHMGRVNSRRRYQTALAWGCDSVDGTYLTFGPDTNLPKLLGWVIEGRDQLTLAGVA